MIRDKKIISEHILHWASRGIILHAAPATLLSQPQYFFNCWCFTSLLKGWEKEITWYSEGKMLEWLSRCKEVARPKPGDIVAFFESGRLWHTALVVDKVCPNKLRGVNGLTILHKNGDKPIVLSSIQEYLVEMNSECYNPDIEIKFYRSK